MVVKPKYPPSTSNEVSIFALITDGDILPLALLVDAIRRTIKVTIITLHMHDKIE